MIILNVINMNNMVVLEKTERIARITLNRPGKMNAITAEMAAQFLSALRHASSDASINCVYLTGMGNGFCAGQDLDEIDDVDITKLETLVLERYNPIILAIRQMEKPVIGAINGIAAGAGANIALACDIVVAS